MSAVRDSDALFEITINGTIQEHPAAPAKPRFEFKPLGPQNKAT
jgi:hypothetical protein